MSNSPTRSGLVLGLLALAHFIVSVDFNIVYIALPEIGREVGFGPQSLQWVVSAYALGFGGFLLLGGRLVDRVGARRVFVAGSAWFAVASVAGLVATTPGVLVAARAGQGIGSALLFPATLALVNTRFEAGPERNRALAVWGVAGASGALAGGGAGGVLTSALGWESVFGAMIPLAAAATLAAPRLLAPDAVRRRATRAAGFDVPGAVTVTAASLLIVFGLVSGPEAGWTSARAGGAVAAGIVLLGLFVAIERRGKAPLMPPRMLANRNLVAATGLIFVLMGPVAAVHYLYTTYLQDVLGYDALAAGLGFLPQSALAMAGSWLLLPPLLRRWGVRATLVVGMVGIAVAIAAVAVGMRTDGTYWYLLPGLMMFGLFAGTAYPAVFAAVGSEVPGDEQGVASAMGSTAQQIGGAVGLAVLVAIANADPVVEGLRTAGLVAAAITAGAVVLAFALRGTRPDAGASAGDRLTSTMVEV
ncbi:MFS transporter [Jiangella asiatica]|uniref:MFS transporter n=1 Tax=Jiangella asiatica TaxID=2530372 RepID=A0A4R5D7R8_9ACTN|nr:MFS transporter [Jiangella asiatica]TDE09456.1 MFS transporter [Jiangella asiatica]